LQVGVEPQRRLEVEQPPIGRALFGLLDLRVEPRQLASRMTATHLSTQSG
jgi:hypothetical protein